MKEKKTAALEGLFSMCSHVDGQSIYLDALKKYVIVRTEHLVHVY